MGHGPFCSKKRHSGYFTMTPCANTCEAKQDRRPLQLITDGQPVERMHNCTNFLNRQYLFKFINFMGPPSQIGAQNKEPNSEKTHFLSMWDLRLSQSNMSCLSTFQVFGKFFGKINNFSLSR